MRFPRATYPANREKYLGVIHDETLRLQRLVNDLLDLARMEAGQMKFEAKPIHLSNLIEQVIGKIGPLAFDKRIQLVSDVPEELPLVLGNEDRLQQVVLNLLDNALRHTPPGGEISVLAYEAEDNVAVTVKDSGEGIPPEELPLIWERFHKVDKARRRAEGGTGLGLAIVKNIIEGHGGTIYAESKQHEGTTFTFLLPKAENRE